MRDPRLLVAAVLAAAFVALPAADVWAQKGKKKDAPLMPDKIDSAKLSGKSFSGTLRTTPNADRMFDLEIPGAGGKVVVEFQLTEKAKVRTLLLTEAFDDKGNPKKYSKKELDDLRGADRSLPGYESSVENLAPGQRVQLTLVSVGKAPAKKGDELGGEKSKQVRLVVITYAPEGSEGGGPAPKKKKK